MSLFSNFFSILTLEAISEYLLLRQILESVVILDESGQNLLNYSSLCEKMPDGLCAMDVIKELTRNGIDQFRQIFELHFPVTENVDLRPFLGSPILSPSGQIADLKALRMVFKFAEPNTEKELFRIFAWETAFNLALNAFKGQTTEVTWFSITQFQTDFSMLSSQLKQLIPYRKIPKKLIRKIKKG